jgi:ATP-binding cassette subfamily B protein
VKHLAYLNKYFSRYKWRILAGIFFVICANSLNTYVPDIVQKAVDEIVGNFKNIQSPGQISDDLRRKLAHDVFLFFLEYLGIALLAGGFTFLMRQMIIVVSRKIEFDLKNDIYNHYQKLDLAFYRRNNTGDLMNRITEDVSRVRMYAGPAIMYSVNLFFTILFVTTRMFMKNPHVALFVLIPLPILSFVIYYVNELVEKASTAIQSKLSDLTTDAQETYSGIRVVQAYAREKEMVEHFKVESETYKRKQLDMAKIDSIYFPSMTFLIGCSVILVVFVGGAQVGAGKLSAGAIAAFLMFTNMLMWPVSSLGWTASMIQRAIASQKRINQFLNYEPAVQHVAGIEKKMEGEIVFDHVSFTYPDTGIVALKNVSFKVNPGQRLAIIGRTGSGKSTIADLIMRMYDVSSGKITVDGSNIKEWNLASLRRQVGFVPQDVFLFSETITDNISFGLNESDKNLAVKSAQYASIRSEIENFPEGFETIVGERGVTLSGGQKQRISIARALSKQPNVLLLDDCLSAVDTATEKEIQQNLDEVLSGKTAIIITHRIFSLIHFDNIIVLDEGKVVEHGTHNELLRRGGLYADIYEKQLFEQREEVEK